MNHKYSAEELDVLVIGMGCSKQLGAGIAY